MEFEFLQVQPTASTREKSGPRIRTANQDASSLHGAALKWLQDWNSMYNDGLSRVPAKVPESLRENACRLLMMARKTGFGLWLAEVYAVAMPISSPTELRSWCKLHYLALQIWEAFEPTDSTYRGTFCFFGGQILSVKDAEDVIRDAAPLMLPDFDFKNPENHKAWFGVLELYDFVELHDKSEDSQRQHSSKEIAGFKMLTERAWQYMRKLGDSWPEEPVEVRSMAEARRVLDEVVRWCQANERPAVAKEGPDVTPLPQAPLSMAGAEKRKSPTDSPPPPLPPIHYPGSPENPLFAHIVNTQEDPVPTRTVPAADKDIINLLRQAIAKHGANAKSEILLREAGVRREVGLAGLRELKKQGIYKGITRK